MDGVGHRSGHHFLLKHGRAGGLCDLFFFLLIAGGAVVAGDDTVEATQCFRPGHPIGTNAVTGLEGEHAVIGGAIEKAVNAIRMKALDSGQAALQFRHEIARIAGL